MGRVARVLVDARLVGSTALGPERPNQGRSRRDWRLILLRLLVVVAFSILLGQLWKLQIVEGRSYRALADVNRFRVSPLSAPRGVIYDRSQRILAANTPSFQIAIVPSGLPSDGSGLVYGELGALLGVSPVEIAGMVDRRNGDDYTPVAIKSDVDRDLVLRVEERRLKLPGVTVVPESSRMYPYGPLLSHILGYMLPISEEQLAEREGDQEAGYRASDRIGATGIEASYEEELRGKPGRKLYEVDVTERPLQDIRIDSPEPGRNLTLSIDVELQKDVERLLVDGMGESESAVAIVMDPRNGQILAMVSVPSYDNNLFSGGVRAADLERLLSDPGRPMLNNATSGNFPPGSTFKLATAIAALQEGVASADTEIVCSGALIVPNQYNPALSQRLPCWGVHGRQDFVTGLANSCDVYYFSLGGGNPEQHIDGLGNDRLAKWAKLMGYGAPTGIDIPGEASGLIPSDSWKQDTWGESWLTGDTYNMAIGQGFVLATPLQVANATNAVANGGRLLRPQLVASIRDEDDNLIREVEPAEIRSIPVEPSSLNLVREGMRRVPLDDDLKEANVPALKIAGKTGTAEFPGPRDKDGILPTHGWFTAFAPYDDPQVSVTVFVRRGGGPRTAAPIAMEIFKKYFRYSEPAEAEPAATGSQ